MDVTYVNRINKYDLSWEVLYKPLALIIDGGAYLVQEQESGFLHPGRVMREQKWVFAPEGTRGVPEVSPIKRVGQLEIWKPLFRFWVFWKNDPPPVRGQGGRIGVANNFGGNTSVRDQCVQVTLILGHIYPQYEFKVIFLVASPPSDARGEPLYNWTWAKKNF